jgi:DNA-binding LytR/AlgR family response regulator
VSSTSKTTPSNIEKKESVSDSVFLRSNKKYVQVAIDTIQYIEAAGNYTKVITSVEVITVREKFSDVFELFSDLDFIQVHKSFAVSKKHIKSIEGNRIFISVHSIPVGKTYKTNIIQLLK